jgi:small subunit ribosomal protein S9
VSIHGDWRKAYGTGRRKTAVARVWLRPGDGNISINKKDLVSYFDRASHRESVVQPFTVTKSVGKWDVKATVGGGGKTGQAEAVRHGIALAIRNAYPDRYTAVLRSQGLTTRDPRMVERKKPGQK